jgi:hypothetical protein
MFSPRLEDGPPQSEFYAIRRKSDGALYRSHWHSFTTDVLEANRWKNPPFGFLSKINSGKEDEPPPEVEVVRVEVSYKLYSTPDEWDSVRQGEQAIKTHETMCLICEQKFHTELLLRLHRIREHEPIEGVCPSSIQEYYQSDLGNMHPHGKNCGGLRGRGTVYRYSRTDAVRGHLEGFILMQQNKNDCRIIRLIAQDWDVEIGQSLLLHVLAHHQNVYALIDNLDRAEYRRIYDGLMHGVSRKHIGEPAALQIPEGFAWTKEACLQILKDDANVYRAFVENAEELGVECNSGGDFYSAEQTQKKLGKDIELAARKLWLLRPNVQIRYEAPILRVEPPSPEPGKPKDVPPQRTSETPPAGGNK